MFQMDQLPKLMTEQSQTPPLPETPSGEDVLNIPENDNHDNGDSGYGSIEPTVDKKTLEIVEHGVNTSNNTVRALLLKKINN